MASLTHDMLDRRWPHAPHSLVDGIVAAAPAVFKRFGLHTVAEQIDFLAQCSEETGGGIELEENLNYTAARLTQVWPRRFPSIAAAMPFAHNPRGLADHVYGGREGNRPGTDDGWTFRGRGLIQITFRSLYEQLALKTGLDLVGRPELAAAPETAVVVACAYWQLAGVNAFADRGDFRAETQRINGGVTNLQSRLAWRAIWRRELGA